MVPQMDLNNTNIYKLIDLYGKENVMKVMQELSPEAAFQLKWNWRFWAQDYQILPKDDEYFGYLCYSGRGTGKALANSTPILTLHGWKTMGKIAVGDKVFDERGYTCNVTAKFSPKKEETNGTYVVKIRHGGKIQIFHTCGDHLWSVVGKSTRQKIRRTEEHDWVGLGESLRDLRVLSTKELFNNFEPKKYFIGTKPVFNTLPHFASDLDFLRQTSFSKDIN